MVISSDKKGTLDAPTYNLLKEVKSGISIVQMNGFNDYEFNPDLYKLDKWVLADFSELGANSYDRSETLIFGKNAAKFKNTDTDQWRLFDKFVTEMPPVLQFKREVLLGDIGGNIYPIDFPCYLPKYPVQSRDEFNARKINTFFYWGHSHESRRALHGNIFVNSIKKDYGVIDNFYHIEQGLKEYKRVWVTIQVPHYARLPMEQVMYINGHSKLSVSLPGAGAKCFRMAEVCANSVMVMQEDKMGYAFPWVHGENCIKIPLGDDFEEIRGLKNQWQAIETIEAALERNDLYEIYLKGVENCDRYRTIRYCREYIEPIISKHI